MASTDDAMEAQPCCRGLSVNESVQASEPRDSLRSKRRSGASSIDGPQQHRKLGFSDEAIQLLLGRFRQYGNNIGEIRFGGWGIADQFLVGMSSLVSSRNQRIMHELSHVLDDVAYSRLFARSGQSEFGWRDFGSAERAACITQQ